jgi:hypothetical protein
VGRLRKFEDQSTVTEGWHRRNNLLIFEQKNKHEYLGTLTIMDSVYNKN